MFCQYVLYTCTIALQNTDFGVLHKSSKHFMISIFFPPVPPPLDTSFLEQVTYFLQLCSSKFVLSIFIYNIALQNTDFGVLQRERERGGGGGER